VPLGTARLVKLGEGVSPRQLIVVHDVEGVFGYVNLCPHESITLNLERNVRTIGRYILCDHHYARFRFSDGMCDDGICAGEALIPVPLAQEGGRIRLE
jgi:nitrite reductase/ring-hydroxylating ferredoxin subunit